MTFDYQYIINHYLGHRASQFVRAVDAEWRAYERHELKHGLPGALERCNFAHALRRLAYARWQRTQ